MPKQISKRSNVLATPNTVGGGSKPINASTKYDAIVLGIAHKEFLNLDLIPLKKEIAVVYDVKGVLENVDMKL